MPDVVGKAVWNVRAKGMAKFQWGKWREDNPLWEAGDYYGVDFLEASCEDDKEASVTVRPVFAEERFEESEAEEFEEGIETEKIGEKVERFEAEEEGEFIRKINDPRLPSEEEIERHRIGGHVEFRDWCDMCVRAKSRDMPHRRFEQISMSF